MNTLKENFSQKINQLVKEKSKKKVYKIEKNFKKGTILILLGLKFKGKKCVFLKFTQNGSMVITGPYRMNGIPLRRINPKYAFLTEIKINLNYLNLNFLSDRYFSFLKNLDKLKSNFKKQKFICYHRARQATMDEYLKKEIKGNFFLKFYIKTVSKIKK